VCLILVGWQIHPDYPLVVAANRDEFYSRPTACAGFWSDQPKILAGRDLQAGGTWLGVTRSGRIAAVTNYRDGTSDRAAGPSRGALVTEFLSGELTPAEFLDVLAGDSRKFNGFNLLVGDYEDMRCFSNVNGESHVLTPGVYGLSNHFLDTPWPKVTGGKSALGIAMNALPSESAVFSLLSDSAIQPDHLLPSTGVSADWERLLSAAFVCGPGYGTRCSTLVTRDCRGRTIFTEKTWRNGAGVEREVRFSFRIAPPAAACAAS
jgi:uncharacterized protein with NRDE domain